MRIPRKSLVDGGWKRLAVSLPCRHVLSGLGTGTDVWSVVLCNHIKGTGLVRDSNPGPLAPKARIIPLDQRAVFESAVGLIQVDLCETDVNLACTQEGRGHL